MKVLPVDAHYFIFREALGKEHLATVYLETASARGRRLSDVEMTFLIEGLSREEQSALAVTMKGIAGRLAENAHRG